MLRSVNQFSPVSLMKHFSHVKSECKRQAAKSYSQWCSGCKKQYIGMYGSLFVTIFLLEN